MTYYDIFVHCSLWGHVMLNILREVYQTERSCICVLVVMYLCVRGHVFVCWGIDFVSFYDFLLEFGNAPTM